MDESQDNQHERQKSK